MKKVGINHLHNRRQIDLEPKCRVEMNSECKRLAKDLKLERACRFLGDISVSEKDRLLNTCDNRFAFPRRNEPFVI
jgi:hypothetical protein